MLSDLVRKAIQSLIETEVADVKKMALDYLFKLQEELQKLDVDNQVSTKLDWFQWLPKEWRTTAKSVMYTVIGAILTGSGATAGWFAKPTPVADPVPAVATDVLVEKIDKLSEKVSQKYRAVGRDRKTGQVVDTFDLP